MVPPVHPSAIVSFAGIAALVAWRLYARVKRTVGRQRFTKRRPWFTVCLFPVLIVLLLLGALGHPANALALVAGVALGAALGLYGLRLTRFETTPTGLFYTPNTHLGLALSLLFVGRLIYRGAQFYALESESPGAASAAFASSPLTLAIFGTLAGYYVTYAAGLLLWEHRLAKAALPVANEP